MLWSEIPAVALNKAEHYILYCSIISCWLIGQWYGRYETWLDCFWSYLRSQLILLQELQEVVTFDPGQQQLKAHQHGSVWVSILTESVLTEIHQTVKRRTEENKRKVKKKLWEEQTKCPFYRPQNLPWIQHVGASRFTLWFVKATPNPWSSPSSRLTSTQFTVKFPNLRFCGNIRCCKKIKEWPFKDMIKSVVWTHFTIRLRFCPLEKRYESKWDSLSLRCHSLAILWTF